MRRATMAARRKQTKPEDQVLNNIILSQDKSKIESYPKNATVTHLDICRFMMIFKGAKKYDFNKNMTPLSCAIFSRKTPILLNLLEEGVDPDSGKVCRKSPLAHALVSEQYGAAKLLISYGADVNKIDEKGNSPMYYAIRQFSPAFIVQDLISAGVPKDAAISVDGNTPLNQAISTCNEEVVKLLLEMAVDLNAPLKFAINSGSVFMVEALISYGANVNGNGTETFRPIFLAAKQGNLRILKLLTSLNAKLTDYFSFYELRVSEQTFIPQYQFYLAIVECDEKKVESFFGKQFVKSKDNLRFAESGLHLSFAIQIKGLNQKRKLAHRKIIQILLNIIDDDLNSLVKRIPQLLEKIALSANWIALEECIRSGLDLKTPVKKFGPLESSIFDLAMFHRAANLIEVCLEFGAELPPPSRVILSSSALYADNQTIIRLFLKRGFPFDEVFKMLEPLDPEGIKLLQCHKELFKCIKLNHSSEIERLDVEVRCCSTEIRHPLHFCSAHGFVDSLKVLLKRGAQPNFVDSKGRTPLHYAAEKGYSEACKSLLRHGACYNHATPQGQTPLSLALQGNNPDTVRVLRMASKCFKMIKVQSARLQKILETLLENVDTTHEFYCYLNCMNRKGNTLLGEALSLKRFDIAKSIIDVKLSSL